VVISERGREGKRGEERGRKVKRGEVSSTNIEDLIDCD
jgi:hypothetical protein